MTVKEWLLRYRKAWKEAQDIELRLTQLRLRYSAPSAIRYSDMPKAHNNTDLSDYMAELERFETVLIKKYQECIGLEVQIYQTVDNIEDVAEREVIRYRYIDGLRWEEIADKIPCALRTVYIIHGRALRHLETCIELH